MLRRHLTRLLLQRMPRAAARPTRVMAERWRRAAAEDPELVRDVIDLGGLLQVPPRDADGRMTQTPEEMAHAAGVRELACRLLGLMQMDADEFRRIMETDHGGR